MPRTHQLSYLSKPNAPKRASQRTKPARRATRPTARTHQYAPVRP
jgi:hypothetical protein